MFNFIILFDGMAEMIKMLAKAVAQQNSIMKSELNEARAELIFEILKAHAGSRVTDPIQSTHTQTHTA